MKSNIRLANEWDMIAQYGNCLRKDKMSYAIGVIEEFNPNFSFSIPLLSSRQYSVSNGLPKDLDKYYTTV
jgi:hypothetical protein